MCKLSNVAGLRDGSFRRGYTTALMAGGTFPLFPLKKKVYHKQVSDVTLYPTAPKETGGAQIQSRAGRAHAKGALSTSSVSTNLEKFQMLSRTFLKSSQQTVQVRTNAKYFVSYKICKSVPVMCESATLSKRVWVMP